MGHRVGGASGGGDGTVIEEPLIAAAGILVGPIGIIRYSWSHENCPFYKLTAGGDWAGLPITQVAGQNGWCIGPQTISCNQLHIPADDERGAS